MEFKKQKNTFCTSEASLYLTQKIISVLWIKSKVLVTHNDTLKIYETIAIKKIFLEYSVYILEKIVFQSKTVKSTVILKKWWA